MQLNDTIKSANVSWDTKLLKEIYNNENMVSFSNYVLLLLDTRFSKDKEIANTGSKEDKDDNKEKHGKQK